MPGGIVINSSDEKGNIEASRWEIVCREEVYWEIRRL